MKKYFIWIAVVCWQQSLAGPHVLIEHGSDLNEMVDVANLVFSVKGGEVSVNDPLVQVEEHRDGERLIIGLKLRGSVAKKNTVITLDPYKLCRSLTGEIEPWRFHICDWDGANTCVINAQGNSVSIVSEIADPGAATLVNSRVCGKSKILGGSSVFIKDSIIAE